MAYGASSPIIRNNIIIHNNHDGIVFSSSNGEAVNNTFYNNGSASWGGGISVENPDAENIVIRNNICSQNVMYQIQVEVTIPDLTMDHNLIDGYRGYDDETYGSDYIEVRNCRIEDNASGEDNGGAYFSNFDTVKIKDCYVARHVTPYDNGALEFSSITNVEISARQIKENTALVLNAMQELAKAAENLSQQLHESK